MQAVEPSAAAAAHITGLIAARTGLDFSDYQPAFLQRRFRRVAESHALDGPVGLAAAIGSQPRLLDEAIRALFLNVTELIRDPSFWSALREDVLPTLSDEPFLRVWVAGCATGEEAFTLSQVLDQAGLRGRYRVYATDVSAQAIATARTAHFSQEIAIAAQGRFERSGGQGLLADWLRFAGLLEGSTRPVGDPIVFARHNLVAGESFNSFHLILCRNVLIYFNAGLHGRVHSLLFESLLPGGVLGLGNRESIRPSGRQEHYDRIGMAHLYRRRDGEARRPSLNQGATVESTTNR
jgi:chemotaxis protein methyltransferase CheR